MGFVKRMSNKNDKKEIRIHKEIQSLTAEETVIKFQAFIHGKLKKCNLTGDEEIFQVCNFALWKAYKTYDINKNTEFMTYMDRCLSNEINMLFRRRKKSNNEFSINTPICFDSDGNSLLVEDIIYDNTFEDYSVSSMDAKNIVKCLDQNDIKYLKFLIKDKKQDEIAAELNLSQSYISRKIKRLRIKMNYIIENGKAPEYHPWRRDFPVSK